MGEESKDSGHSNDKPLDGSEREELRRLRKESANLRMEAEFAKKVATWFAKEPS